MLNLDKLKDLSKEKGLSLRFICQKLEVAPSYFNDIKLNRTTATVERIQLIADLLDTTPEYLTDQTDEKTKKGSPNSESDKRGGLSEIYFNFAKSAQDRKIDPRDIEYMLEAFEKMKKAKDDENK